MGDVTAWEWPLWGEKPVGGGTAALWGRRTLGDTRRGGAQQVWGYLCCSQCCSCLLRSHLQDRRRAEIVARSPPGCPQWDGCALALPAYSIGDGVLRSNNRALLRGPGAVQIWVQTFRFPSCLLKVFQVVFWLIPHRNLLSVMSPRLVPLRKAPDTHSSAFPLPGLSGNPSLMEFPGLGALWWPGVFPDPVATQPPGLWAGAVGPAVQEAGEVGTPPSTHGCPAHSSSAAGPGSSCCSWAGSPSPVYCPA